MRIDSHQHFWRYTPEEYGWIAPHQTVLQKDYLPGDLAPLLETAGIDGSVAVQARQTVGETAWLLKLAEENPIVKGVVGWIDLCSPDFRDQLEPFTEHPKFSGVRHILHDEADDRYMMREEFMRGVAALGQLDLTYDLLIRPQHLRIALDFVKHFPEQRFVVDHIAKPLIAQGKASPWDADIRKLAGFKNVYCKISGMVTEADPTRLTPDVFRPYLDTVFEAFSPKRLMIGSDWPVCLLAASYEDVIGIAADYLASLSRDEQADVWGRTAAKFYRLGA
ncbi:MAG: amidohydrolase family protein [Phycisphaerae bacterium]|nr:amidohydrolase family protein [Phycisphaerae bacterium]